MMYLTQLNHDDSDTFGSRETLIRYDPLSILDRRLDGRIGNVLENDVIEDEFLMTCRGKHLTRLPRSEIRREKVSS